MVCKYNKICLGGTFDVPLHEGHKMLLGTAPKIAYHFMVAITSDERLKKNPKKHAVRPFTERSRGVREFYDANDIDPGRYAIKPLTGDVYNDRLMRPDCDIEAILVSEETMHGAATINRERNKMGLQSFAVEVVQMVLAEDGERISTSRIYERKIDKYGKVLKKSE